MMLAAENGHHGIAHEFINVAVLCNHLLHNQVEVGVEQAHYVGGRELFGQRRETANVQKNHRGFHRFAGQQAIFKIRPGHEIQHRFVDVHFQDVIFLNGAQRVAQLAHLVGRFLNGELQVVEIDGLHHEVEGAPVHGGAQVGQIAVGRYDDRFHGRVLGVGEAEQGQPVHHRHVDVAENDGGIGVLGDTLERLLPVVGKHKLVHAFPNLAPKLLLDEQLKVGFVVDHQDFRLHNNSVGAAGRK